MKKTICIIRSNAVDPDSRVEKEAATLKKLGYRVIILAWDRSSNHKLAHEYINVYDEKIDIFRLGYKAKFGAGMKSLIPYLKFQCGQFKWLIKNKEEIDAIHACDFDTALFSCLANCFMKKKYVFDIFDFICGNPQNLIEKIVKKIQLEIINKSDATIICTEKRKEQIKLSHPKILEIIHNTPMISGERRKIELKCQDIDRKIKVVYVGILQDFRLLKEITSVLKNNSQYEFHIGGFGKYEEFFRIQSKNCNNIVFHGKLSYEDTLKLEYQSDIMLAIYDPSIENHYYAAPNKFYESLMLGKPLMMVKGTGMSEYIEKYKIGTLIEYTGESFMEGLETLVLKKTDWQIMGKKMQEIYIKEFSWDVMGKRLARLYSNIFE